MFKERKYIFGAVLVILILLFCLILSIKSYTAKVEISFFDIGQGDSSLIKFPNNKIILVDGGPDNLVLNRLGKYLPYYERKIDLVVLSHFHDDHIMGLIEIINRYKVGSLLYMKGSKDSPLLKELLNKAQKNNVKVIALDKKMEINYQNNCVIKLLNPLSLKIKIDDNNSVIMQVNCGLLKAVLTGDSNSEVEKALLNTKENWSTSIFKASHHGSKTANSEEFLKALKPKMIVVSVGVNNRFNHPSPETLELFKKLKINYKRTDINGSIILTK